MSKSTDLYISIYGKLVKESAAYIPAVSSGLYYGAGCFETLRYENRNIFRLNSHIDRLNNGLKYLGVEKSSFIKQKEISNEIEKLIILNELQNKCVRVRVQISLIETKGYQVEDNLELVKIITCKEINESGNDPVKLMISDTRVVPGTCRPATLKLSNMLHYRNAYRNAIKSGHDDALLLTLNGHLAESSMANLFWKKGDTIFTPSVDCDILPGIMRNAVIEIIKNYTDLELIEGKFSPTHLDNADLIWLTNSVIGIKPVGEYQDKVCRTDNKFISQLKNDLHYLKEREKL